MDKYMGEYTAILFIILGAVTFVAFIGSLFKHKPLDKLAESVGKYPYGTPNLPLKEQNHLHIPTTYSEVEKEKINAEQNRPR